MTPGLGLQWARLALGILLAGLWACAEPPPTAQPVKGTDIGELYAWQFDGPFLRDFAASYWARIARAMRCASCGLPHIRFEALWVSSLCKSLWQHQTAARTG